MVSDNKWGVKMKIKLAILESDVDFLKNYSIALSSRFSDKLEVYTFSNLENAMSALADSRIDVFLAGDNFEIDTSNIPEECGFAYLVDSNDIKSFKSEHTVCRFQKIDLIYRDILGIFSEKEYIVSGSNMANTNCKVLLFTGIEGGTGASSAAAACALYFAQNGKRVLYLNIEKFGSADMFFYGEGQYTMSDIVYNIKSKKSNLSLKLESSVKIDKRGVYFFSSPNLVLDLLELDIEDKKLLINTLVMSSQYDYIVIDCDFGMQKDDLELYSMANEIILVGDGSEISNDKTVRAIASIQILEQEKNMSICRKTMLLYNRFNNYTGRTIENLDIRTIAGIPPFENLNTQQIITKISGMQFFNVLE